MIRNDKENFLQPESMEESKSIRLLLAGNFGFDLLDKFINKISVLRQYNPFWQESNNGKVKLDNLGDWDSGSAVVGVKAVNQDFACCIVSPPLPSPDFPRRQMR